MSIDVMKQALKAAYLAGFVASEQGHNGEYPFRQYDENPEDHAGWRERRDSTLRLAIEQAERQEPVAWVCTCGANLYVDDAGRPCSKVAPPQRQPLTDEQVCDLWSWSATAEAERTATTQQHAFARAIERAHGIGGEG
jgi:hypothetical protein